MLPLKTPPSFSPAKEARRSRLLPSFAGSSPPMSPKNSPTSLWKSLVLTSVGWPRSTVEKGPQSNESYERKTLETVPFQPYFECTKSFLKVLSNEYCQATRAMRAKRVVTVPLQPYFEFHWIWGVSSAAVWRESFRNRTLPFISVAPPAEPRGEKKLLFVQISGGEKLLKFVEKCRWNTFKRPERG